MHIYFYYFVFKVSKSKFFQMMQEIEKISSLTEQTIFLFNPVDFEIKAYNPSCNVDKNYLVLRTGLATYENQYCTWLNWKKLYVWHFNRNFSILFFQNLWQRWPPLCPSKQGTLRMKTGSQKNKMGILFFLIKITQHLNSHTPINE